MNRREKWLGMGLLATLGAAWGADYIDAIGSTISTTVPSEVAVAEDRLRKRSEELVASREKLRSLDEWKNQSLPADPALAGMLYQELLLLFIDRAGFNHPAIQLASPMAMEHAGSRFQFTISLKGTTSQLRKFLVQLEACPLLHQIKQIQIQHAEGPESGQCHVAMVIESLGLHGSERVSLEACKNPLRTHHASQDLLVYDLFRRPDRNPPKPSEFSIGSLLNILRPQTSTALEQEDPTENEVTSPNPLVESIPIKPRLVGIIGQGDHRTALIHRSKTDAPLLLAEKATLEPLGLEGTIQQISKDSIQILRSTNSFTVRLGDLLDF